MKIDVINSKIYSNPYQRLLYTAIGRRYQIAPGTLNTAIAQQRLKAQSIYHIHWEESLLSRCTSISQANRVRREYIQKLKRYSSKGGKIVWTLHNIIPHEQRFLQSFLALRKSLAAVSHSILVHNQATLSILREQIALSDLSKVNVLPHPAYFDVYEPADKTISLAGRAPANPRTLLCFGLIRAYKGISGLIQRLPPDFMASHQLELRICGKPFQADSFLDDLLAQGQARSEITYSLDAVPSEEVADLFRSHAGLVIPYHNVLTSGVAVLALTLGVPAVAPHTVAMRELFPESAHFLLFNPESTEDFHRALLMLVGMSAETRALLAGDYIKKALLYHPHVISNALGKIYDDLLEGKSANEERAEITTS